MAATRTTLSVGDMVYYHDPGSQRECTVVIEAILEGYPPRRYQCTNLDTGTSFWSYGCWLKPILVDDEPFSWTQLEDETLCVKPIEVSHVSEENEIRPPACKQARFVDLTDEQLDRMAADRVSKNTQQQTKWGMKIFTGKLNEPLIIFTNIV